MSRKDIEGIVEIELKSGIVEIKFDWEAIEYIETETGKAIIDYITGIQLKSLKNVDLAGDAKEQSVIMAKNFKAKEITLLLFAGLMHTEKYKTIAELKKELLPENQYHYTAAVVVCVGKLITGYITKK